MILSAYFAHARSRSVRVSPLFLFIITEYLWQRIVSLMTESTGQFDAALPIVGLIRLGGLELVLEIVANVVLNNVFSIILFCDEFDGG